MADRDVIILGGGLAGIAAAVRLVRGGLKPTLIERRPFLGGRAFSFVDRETGEEIDNGQHVILGVCTEFLDLLEELGTRDQIDLEAVLDVPVSMDGEISQLRASRVFGNAVALLRYGHLSVSERFAISRVMMALKFSRLNHDETEHAKTISFSDWLTSRGMSDAAIGRFWSLFILPVFNCHIEDVVAQDAIEFTRAALLGKSIDAAIGFPKVGLSSLIGNPAEKFLRAHGAEILTNVRVERIETPRLGIVDVRLSNGETLRSRAVVSGLAPNILSRILPETEPRFERVRSSLSAFEYSPIVAVHLWFERPVMEERVIAFIDLGLQWVFNDSALRGKTTDRSQHIVISLSGAHELERMSKREVLELVVAAMKTAFPDARGNRIVNSSVVKTLEATIKVNRVSAPNRLKTSTDVPSIFLAGDWTDTGLPATMEGAVQSGNAAAALAVEVLRTSNDACRSIVDD